MSRYGKQRVVGRIRSRLLVNAVVDPAEAAQWLPPGLQPHVVDGATIVGCCLLDLAHVRPAAVAAVPGLSFRAAAHRISVEWNGHVGVWVPARLTSSRLAQAIGGRAFPGVHRAARTTLVADDGRLAWSVVPRSSADYAVRVTASVSHESVEAIGATCLAATVGVSPDHRGALEAAVMAPRSPDAQRVMIESLDSGFIASFASAQLAPSYVMRDVDVEWFTEAA